MAKINSSNIIRGSTVGLANDGNAARLFINMLQWGDGTYLRWGGNEGKDTLLQHKLRD